MDLFSLEGKVALVTGGSRGIGSGIAHVLGQLGADVAVSYRTKAQGAENIATSIRELGREAITLKADVGVPIEARGLVERTLDHFGHLDIVVNNAGGNLSPPVIVEMELDEIIERWDTILNANLAGQFHVAHAAMSSMIERGWGRIINISSISGVRGGLIGDVEYSAAKAGILGFTRSLARYVAPHGITVNALAVGLVATDSLRTTVPPERIERLIKTIPLGRLGVIEDIGYLVGFLASEQASWITGETIQINGGQHIA